MKIFVYAAAFFALTFCLLSKESAVQLELSEVKIFISGAELTHAAKLQLKPGSNDIILENVANNITQNSINAYLSANATIMSITEKRDYLKPKEKPQEVKILEDSVDILNYKFAELNNQIQALDAEAELLSLNKTISGKDKVMTITDLKDISDFYYQKMLEIKNSKLQLNEELKDFQKQLSMVQSQLNEMNTKNTKSVHQILITISSKVSQDIDLALKYFVADAGWVPFYDIRVKDVNQPINFYHKANVWQNTGIDWNDVKLTISTRNPTIYGSLPEINPVYLDFAETQVPRGNYVGTINTTSAGIEKSAEEYKIRGSESSESQIKIDGLDIGSGVFKSVNNTLLTSISAEFTTDINYTVPTDNKVHLVDLKTSEIPGIYEYYTAPKYQLESYLVAKITNWQDINLLPGSANVYFENSYTGQTQLEPDVTTDTLNLSLGADKNIIVTRDIIKDFTETKFLSSDIERFFAYKITVKNTKKTKIRITIEEQIPVSKNEDIKVKLIEGSEGKLEAETGKIKWVADIEPGKSIEKQLKFSVRHPKDKKVSNY